MQYRFDDDIALKQITQNRYAAEITSDYNIAAPNGGYLMAIAANALQQTSHFQIPLSLTATYHKPTSAGFAELVVKEVARNKRLRTALVSLIQNDVEVTTYIGTFTHETAFSGVSMVQTQPCLPALSDCHEITDIPLRFFDPVRVFLPENQLKWMRGEHGEEAVFTGYFGFRDDRPLDALSILLFADASPPPILRHTGPLAWVPTIELSVQVRSIPTGIRIGYRATTRFVTNGLTETDVELWSESGEIVALSRQLAVIKEGLSVTEST